MRSAILFPVAALVMFAFGAPASAQQGTEYCHHRTSSGCDAGWCGDPTDPCSPNYKPPKKEGEEEAAAEGEAKAAEGEATPGHKAGGSEGEKGEHESEKEHHD